MRVLVDESLPKALAAMLVGHEARTVRQMRWAGLKNGELLRRAAAEGIDAIVTADQSLEYQQNVARAGLGVIVLIAPSNQVQHLAPLVSNVLRALAMLRPGQVVRVGTKPSRGRRSRHGHRDRQEPGDGTGNGSAGGR